ncbi:MAG: flagellar protein FlaG [Candidatus Sericytochromatia bacterium]|nr:flagellar protein FlaG [Candidatus Sericytochromatia bacterium]
MSGIMPVTRRLPLLVPQSATSELSTGPPAKTVAGTQAEVSRAEVLQSVEALNRVLDPLNLSLTIKYDEARRTYGFKIVDRQTKEVIREFPFPGVLAAVRDAAQGLFVDQRS